MRARPGPLTRLTTLRPAYPPASRRVASIQRVADYFKANKIDPKVHLLTPAPYLIAAPKPCPFPPTAPPKTMEPCVFLILSARRLCVPPQNTPYMWIRYAFIFGTLAAAWYAQLVVAETNFALGAVMALVVGLCCALVRAESCCTPRAPARCLTFCRFMWRSQIGLTPMHDGSHFSITHSPLVWRVLGMSHDFLNGSSYVAVLFALRRGHILLRAPWARVRWCPDVGTLCGCTSTCSVTTRTPTLTAPTRTSTPVWLPPRSRASWLCTVLIVAGCNRWSTGEVDLRRIKTSQKWYNRYIVQHIYIPIIYALLGVKTR